MLFTFDFPRGRTVDAETSVRASTGINRDDNQSNRVRKFLLFVIPFIRANSLDRLTEIIREEILVYFRR